MTILDNILLGAFAYGDSKGTEKHLYGVLDINTDVLDYNVRYIDDKELKSIYSSRPELYDFVLNEDLMFWRGTPVEVGESVAKRSMNVSFSMELKEDSFYNLFWYLAKNKFMYLDPNILTTETEIPFIPLHGVCGFHELNFPEESLSIEAIYNYQGKLERRSLLSYGGQDESFRVLTNIRAIDPLFAEYIQFDREIRISGREYCIYKVSFVGSAIPDMSTLGMYLPNLICFLKLESVRLNALVDSIGKLIQKHFKGKGIHSNHVSIYQPSTIDDSAKVKFSLDYNLELVELIINDFITPKSDNSAQSIKFRFKELDEIEKFVVMNIMKLYDAHYTDVGFSSVLSTAKSEFNIVRTYYNIMLMIQRASITYNTPAKMKLSQEGICGLTKGTTTIEIGG